MKMFKHYTEALEKLMAIYVQDAIMEFPMNLDVPMRPYISTNMCLEWERLGLGKVEWKDGDSNRGTFTLNASKAHKFLEPHWKLKVWMASHAHMFPALIPLLAAFVINWQFTLVGLAIAWFFGWLLAKSVNWQMKITDKNKQMERIKKEFGG